MLKLGIASHKTGLIMLKLGIVSHKTVLFMLVLGTEVLKPSLMCLKASSVMLKLGLDSLEPGVLLLKGSLVTPELRIDSLEAGFVLLKGIFGVIGTLVVLLCLVKLTPDFCQCALQGPGQHECLLCSKILKGLDTGVRVFCNMNLHAVAFAQQTSVHGL